MGIGRFKTQAGTGRIAYIDFLKFIGMTGIIIAHVGSPNWLMQLRSFDVPMMVILSAYLAKQSYEKRIDTGGKRTALSFFLTDSNG